MNSIIALLVFVSIASAQEHWRCQEPHRYSCQIRLMGFDTYNCLSTFQFGFYAQDTKNQMRRLDLHVFQNGKMSNVTIWQFYQQNMQYIYDRGSKMCQSTQTGSWSDTWAINATFSGNMLSGLQLLENYHYQDPAVPVYEIGIYMTPGSSCIPVRVEAFNTTGRTMVFEEQISDWTNDVDEDLFQDLPAACSQAKQIPFYKRLAFKAPLVWF